MKDGRTHLAHKAEHAVDLDTGAIVVVTVQGADQGDTTTIDQTLAETVEQLITVEKATDESIQIASEIVADKAITAGRRSGSSTTWAAAGRTAAIISRG
jgi:transposase